MANVLMFRGGSADFKGWFCDGQFAQFNPPFSAPHYDYTPPFDSHADAAYGQGYLNLVFPLVPNLNDTYGHTWQQHALKGVKAVDDVILTNWVPLRSYVESLYIECNKIDEDYAGVTLTPVAKRVVWNFTTNEFDYQDNAAFDAFVAAGTATQISIGDTTASPYIFATADTQANKLATFGHNIVTYDASGVPTGGYDAYFGGVVIGLKVAAGDSAKIENLWKGNFAVYLSAKIHAFEAPTQIG